MSTQAQNILVGIRSHPSKQQLITLFELETRGEGLDSMKVWEDYTTFIALKILLKNFCQQTTVDFVKYQLEPSAMIDRMWRLHILDTKNHSQFCKDISGPLIHHDPFGRVFSSDQEREKRKDVTKSMYENVFQKQCPFFNEQNRYTIENEESS